jgi:hypothetical protein
MPDSPLGIHYIPVHSGRGHYDFIQAINPHIVKLVSGNKAPDVQMMAEIYNRASRAIHIYRIHSLSEQHDELWRDPIGTAKAHVNTWFVELSERTKEAESRELVLPPVSQTMTLGINEPVIELFARQEDMSNYPEWLDMVQDRTALLDDYMATYATESLKFGQPCCIGNFSFGQPANKLPGEYATYRWFPKTQAIAEGAGGKVGLAVHEYWDIDGPDAMANWGPYRFTHCEWKVPIYVLECGVDRAIHGAYEGNRGWYGHLTPIQYAEQVFTYIRTCMRDKRFVGATPFTLDGDEMWWSFWVDNCMTELIAVSDRLQKESDHTVGPTIYLPTVPNEGPKTPTETPPEPQPVPSSNWGRTLDFILKIEGGFQNDPNDPGNWTGGAVGIGELKGTKYGISAASYPDLDIVNLTVPEASVIYERDYWRESGADELPWPLCLAHCDLAVNGGVGRAMEAMTTAGPNFLRYMAWRIDWYTRISNFERYGRSWERRCAAILNAVAEAE